MSRLLLVDDNPRTRDRLHNLLQEQRWSVTLSHHGAEALALARATPPDLVISDLHMPVMDGYTLLRQWKADDRLRAIPFLVYAPADAEQKEEQLALALGADAFLLKPAEPQALVACVTEILARGASGEVSQPQHRGGDEMALLRGYSETLIRQLEEKARQLERANQDLAEREAQLRLIFDAEPECVKLLGPDGALREMNRAGLAMIEADSFAQVAQQCVYPLVAEEHRAAFRALTESVFRGEAGTLAFEVVGLRGGRRWLETHAAPLRDPSGRITALLGITRDITSARQAEAALRESEARLRLATDSSNTGLWDWNIRTNEVYFSPIWKRQIGYDDWEIANRFDEWESRVHPDDLPRVRAVLRSYLENPGPNYENEFRFRHRDGSYRRILAKASLIRDSRHQPLRMLGSHLDITDRHALEQQLAQSQKIQALGTLAGGVAHDFNNLLATMFGNAELAQLRLPADHPAGECLAELMRAGQRAKELVARILAFSRPNDQELTPIHLGPVVEEVLQLLRSALPARVELASHFPAGLPVVRADPAQIHQVVLNLATNAWHAMEGRTGRLELRLEPCQLDAQFCQAHPGIAAGPAICLSVSDTGKGMDAATLERIFEPFFTTKPPGMGTGLGLSIVHSIVRAHRGAVDVESHPGRGTTFRLYLPACPESPPLPRAAKPASNIPRGHNERILYLDDEESLVQLVVRFLEKRGYRVTSFKQANEALAAFEADPSAFELVITDFNMPEASGISVARRILELRPGMPIILVSGFMPPEEVQQTKAIGVENILLKPFAVDELSALIQRLLAARPGAVATASAAPDAPAN